MRRGLRGDRDAGARTPSATRSILDERGERVERRRTRPGAAGGASGCSRSSRSADRDRPGVARGRRVGLGELLGEQGTCPPTTCAWAHA